MRAHLRFQIQDVLMGSNSDSASSDFKSDSDDEVVVVLLTSVLQEYLAQYYDRIPCRTSMLRGDEYVLEVLNGHHERCPQSFRMETHVFRGFCNALREHGGLKNSRRLTVEEQVCIFLITVGHNMRNRVIQERFQHSGETISKYFNRVLKAVCKFGKKIIRPPSFDEIPEEIRHNPKFWPYFKDCIGAIDGTHVSARVPCSNQIPYRGRHVSTTQNVMCACSFDMVFTYVLTGWEGTANDSRVLQECANNPSMRFPLPPEGKYYVVDSGYQNMPGFMSPYKGERYHLENFRGRANRPRKVEEWFNYRHSSLRNVIERCFGVLKARFPILSHMPKGFKVKTQKYIPTACCTVHNYIRMYDENDPLFLEYGVEDLIVPGEGPTPDPGTHNTLNITPAQLRKMQRHRDRIAHQIFLKENGEH